MKHTHTKKKSTFEGNDQDKSEPTSATNSPTPGGGLEGRKLHLEFYVRMFGAAERRENKPNAILIVGTFQRASTQ